MFLAADPIGAGLVPSLARPGGRFTGLTTMDLELDAKRVDLLHEAIPELTRARLLTTGSRGSSNQRRAALAQELRPQLKLYDHFDQEPCPVLQQATPSIGATIRKWTEELRDEIAVSRMKRNTAEAGILHSFGGKGELAGERRGIDVAADLTSGMTELSPEVGAPRRSGFGKSGELSAAALIVDDDVVRPLQMPPVDLDVAGDQKARARAGPAPVERFQPGRGMVAGVGEAFAHRRLGDAIGKRGAARKVKRPVEKICHGFPIWLAATANFRSQ